MVTTWKIVVPTTDRIDRTEKGGQNHRRDIRRAIETCVCGGDGGGQRHHGNARPWNQRQRIKWVFPKRMAGGDEKHWHESGECLGGG